MTMSLGCGLFLINIVSKFHVSGVDSENFQSADSIGDSNINLAVKTSKATKSRINRVWSVGSGHDNGLRSLFKTVHQGQKLGNNSALNFAMGFLSFWGNGVQFINENNGGRILFSFLKSFTKIRFRFTS